MWRAFISSLRSVASGVVPERVLHPIRGCGDGPPSASSLPFPAMSVHQTVFFFDSRAPVLYNSTIIGHEAYVFGMVRHEK